MLPTNTIEQPESGREAIKRDFYDLDNLISELNVSKEQINNSLPTSTGMIPGDESTGNVYSEFENQQEAISPEIAALSGKAIAGTIDTVLSTGFSLYAKSSSTEKFEANDKQIEKLNQAWQAVAQKYNYKIEDSPWFNVILLTVAVYLPIWKEAQKDHRFAEMDEKLEEMKAEMKKQAAALELVKNQQNTV